MTSHPDTFDVAIVGYGPVSESLALALARQGRSVAVFERWEERYPLPRAVCVDHEIYRLLCTLGLRDSLPAVSHAGPWYRWFNADWKELLAIDWSAESISGGPEVHFVHQPTLEDMLDKAVRSEPNVRLHLGWQVDGFSQTDEEVSLTVRHLSTGESRSVRARYLVGADGANSTVRQILGGTREDRGFEADWLVIDVLPNQGVELDIPPAAQYCNPTRPTTIVPAGVRDGRYFRRWEFMRLPGESVDSLEHEDRAWELLSPWVRRDQAVIVRHKIYTFRSLLADQWRQARVLLAGDAAHLMPPFMGQGMCAGLRDVANLAWKLGWVLDGRADASLLDTYQQERRPHVSDVIDISTYLGKIICVPDPAQAAERDDAFFSGRMPPPPPFPHVTAGLVRRGGTMVERESAGLLSPHGTVRRQAQGGRFDDALGVGWRLVVREAAVLEALSPSQSEALKVVEARVVLLSDDDDSADPRAWRDVDGKFLPWMQSRRIAAMLVRPDFYIYGAAESPGNVDALIDDLRSDLQASGLRLAGAHQPAAT